jgi:hypothetical protein
MYSKEEKKALKVGFWTSLNDKLTEAGKAKGRNLEWMSYPTQLKPLFFRMEADETSARLCIDVQFFNDGVREVYFQQFEGFETILKKTLGDDLIFQKEFEHWNGKTISRIYCELADVNVNKKEDWEKIQVYLTEKFLKLDEFWQEFSEVFTALK